MGYSRLYTAASFPRPVRASTRTPSFELQPVRDRRLAFFLHFLERFELSPPQLAPLLLRCSCERRVRRNTILTSPAKPVANNTRTNTALAPSRLRGSFVGLAFNPRGKIAPLLQARCIPSNSLLPHARRPRQFVASSSWPQHPTTSPPPRSACDRR